ncbi:MAG: hypothetical protein QOC87_1513 [Actinomycetota bacterium]|nr:hypothetical protein [Actinomycetota bacterium]
MRGLRAILPAIVALTLAAALVPPAAAGSTSSSSKGVHTVIAIIDSGINPYSIAFRDNSPEAFKDPSTYIPGYPKGTPALHIHLNLPYDQAVKKDAAVWAQIQPGKLYWIPGTRIVGAISLGAGGTNCPNVTEIPPASSELQGNCQEHRILDDLGHGTMTASRAAGDPHSLDPTAKIVEVEGLGGSSAKWAADQGWIDVQTNSWLSLAPPPVPAGVAPAFKYAAKHMLTLAASGNGSAFIAGVAPTPTYLLSTAPPGVVLVGGDDNGKMTLWAGAPPHVVADAYSGYAANFHDNGPMKPDPEACCTSAASPYAAGGAGAIIKAAREVLGDTSTGVHDGVIAQGTAGLVSKGPLADGKFTLDELKDVFFHTAEARPAEGKDDGAIHWSGEPRPPDHTEFGPGANPFCIGCMTTPVEWKQIPDAASAYALIGYGGINERSVALAQKVLQGSAALPARPTEDAQYQLDQQIREIIFSNQ